MSLPRQRQQQKQRIRLKIKKERMANEKGTSSEHNEKIIGKFKSFLED
jgi:hypothetical protein